MTSRRRQMIRGGAVICYLLLLALQASSVRASDLTASSREFVQKFYEIYVPKALAGQPSPPWRLAVDKMSADFDGELIKAMKDDLAAQAKAQEQTQAEGGDIVGLDFDPFLDSQDPAKRYEVGSARQEGADYLVDVYAVTSGKRSEQPSVVPELAFQDGHWHFVNFRYPEGGDLLTLLKQMKADRESQQN